MSKRSDIESYFNSSPYSNSQQSKKARKTLRWSGFAVFCLLQLILGSWSTVLLLLTVVNKKLERGLLVNLSILLALSGLVYLIISIYNSFYYGNRAGKFTIPDRVSLKKSTGKKIIKTIFLSSLIGICMAFLGSIIITGEILSKMLAPQPGILFPNYQNTAFVTLTDIFISQACISIMAAHCAGVINSLWTLNQIEKSSVDSVPLTIDD